MGRLVVQNDYFPSGTFDSFNFNNQHSSSHTNNNHHNAIVIENNLVNDNRSFDDVWSADAMMSTLTNSTPSYSTSNQTSGISIENNPINDHRSFDDMWSADALMSTLTNQSSFSTVPTNHQQSQFSSSSRIQR